VLKNQKVKKIKKIKILNVFILHMVKDSKKYKDSHLKI